jgi:hypothetical protein
MATNKSSQGDQRQGNHGSSQRGFAGMDDASRREAASKGGQTSANEQARDDQGQFAGTGSRSGGPSMGQGGSGGQGANRGQGGNAGQARDDQGQFTSGGRSGQDRNQGGGSNR